MKAMVYDCYGSANGLRLAKIDHPQLKPKQLLVKVNATSINPVDWKVCKGMLKFFTGFNFPRVAGSDLVGKVVAVGHNRTPSPTGSGGESNRANL